MAVVRASLEALHEEGARIGREVQEAFSALDEKTLNHRPGPDRWSIAQCLDHLRITDEGYLELGRRLAAGEGNPPWTAHLPGLPRLLGGLLLGSLTPRPTRRYKAPGVWLPSSSDLPASVVPDFLERQTRILEMIRQALSLDNGQRVIASPATPWLCYTWADALRILIAHQRRHVNQAVAVLGGQKG